MSLNVPASPLHESSSMTRSVQVVWMLASREWIRFFRQPFRVIAAFGQPILFWILFGTGMHGVFRSAQTGTNFMTYFLPGTTALILLFTAIFATISIIEDRREGFLQGVLVSPAPRWTIALGKAMGGSAIAWAQAIVFLVLAAIVGSLTIGWSTIALAAFLFLAAVGLTSLGVCFAWPMDSTQGFHAAMNLILMPMWLLSGAFFPVPLLTSEQPVGQVVLHWIMRMNPMTYIVGGLRELMSTVPSSDQYWSTSLQTSWIITLLFAFIATAVATIIVRRKQTGEFQ